jgi:hypothetical protein
LELVLHDLLLASQRVAKLPGGVQDWRSCHASSVLDVVKSGGSGRLQSLHGRGSATTTERSVEQYKKRRRSSFRGQEKGTLDLHPIFFFSDEVQADRPSVIVRYVEVTLLASFSIGGATIFPLTSFMPFSASHVLNDADLKFTRLDLTPGY